MSHVSWVHRLAAGARSGEPKDAGRRRAEAYSDHAGLRPDVVPAKVGPADDRGRRDATLIGHAARAPGAAIHRAGPLDREGFRHD